MAPMEDCPLGKIPNLVMQCMLHSCPELTVKVNDSGVHVAMDNFFTSPTLLLCLETHKIYGVGTVRTNRIGLKGAVELFRAEGSKLSNKGDMNFARSGTLAVVEWKDTKIVTLASTIHNTKKDFEPQPFE